jgi:hypothetical protein
VAHNAFGVVIMRILCWSVGGLVALCGLCTSTAEASIVFGQRDTFLASNGNPDVMGWIRGVNAITLPSVVLSGGPGGANDAYLQNTSTGTTGSNSRMSMFNQDQWTGDYLDAGVTLITADMADFGTTPLYMRLAIEDDFGTEWGSTDAAFLPADGKWHSLSFDMTAAGLTNLQGAAPLSHSLANVGILRMVSNQEGPNFRGDILLGVMGVDNITALPEPAFAPLLAIGAGLLRRRQRSS